MSRTVPAFFVQERLLRTRLCAPDKVPNGHSRVVAERLLGPFLEKVGLEIEFVDTYSSDCHCAHVVLSGRSYVIIDHALGELFDVLNFIFGTLEPDASFTAALLQRTLAEACRSRARAREFAFFVRRAIEVKQFTRLIQEGGRHSVDAWWQDVLILGHEIAHALPADLSLAVALRTEAQSRVSLALDESISALTGVLLTDREHSLEASVLDDLFGASDIFGEKIDTDQEVLFATFRRLGVTAADIEEIYENHCISDRFLNEITSDLFGLFLVESSSGLSREQDAGSIDDILLATFRTFLNMRFLSYTRQIVDVPSPTSSEPTNPLDLTSLIEFTIRGKIARAACADARHRLCLRYEEVTDPDVFLHRVREVADLHTERIFEPFNALLEQTILNPGFVLSLDTLLEEDGFDAAEFREDPLIAVSHADAFWRVLVS